MNLSLISTGLAGLLGNLLCGNVRCSAHRRAVHLLGLCVVVPGEIPGRAQCYQPFESEHEPFFH